MIEPETFDEEKYVNVVFATDAEYLPVTNVALTSVAINYKDDRRLRAFVLTDQPLTEHDATRFQDLSAKHDFDFTAIPISASHFDQVRTTRGISIATYFRLYMHLALPPDVKKVVYLDSDMVVLGNVAHIFDTELGTKLFAGAEDYNSEAHRSAYDTPEKSVNVNAGVLVCNIVGMREMDFLGTVQDYIEKNRFRIFHGDQQILNHLFHNRMKYLHIRWNMHGQLFEPAWVRANMKGRALMSYRSMEEGRTRPKVIHYNGGVKPWNGGAHPKRREWYKYATLSTYADMFPPPKWPSSKKKPKLSKLDRFYKFFWLDKLSRALNEGYRARSTRLLVDASISKGGIWKNKQFDDVRTLAERASILQFHQYLMMRGMVRRDIDFSASAFVSSLPEGAKIFANAPGNDLEGGFHENLKEIFRTPHVGMKVLPYEADFALILHMAIRTPGFWDALLTSSFDRDLIFGEAAFFGAYAGYFDKDAPPITRRPFGYILDDLGYYYDARQPTRLEMKLNSPAYRVAASEIERCKRLIERVKNEHLTKYNRYCGRGSVASIEPGAVIVIDQTPHDASIKFGSAEKRTIVDMVNAALRENPDAPVYFKRHPDNVQKNRNTIPATSKIRLLPDDADITLALDACSKVYVVSSQVGFEAILRGKTVVTFGMPFYAGWGLTDDRQAFKRRAHPRTVEELFYAACIDLSVYLNPLTGQVVEIEEAFDVIREFRAMETRSHVTETLELEAAE